MEGNGRRIFQSFLVRCVDASSKIGELTKEKVYEVTGAVQGFFFLVNDKGKEGMYYRERFQIVEEDDEPNKNAR